MGILPPADAVLAAQAIEDDADLLLGREVPLGGPANVPDRLLRALRSLLVSISHRVLPGGDDEPEILSYAISSKCSVGPDEEQSAQWEKSAALLLSSHELIAPDLLGFGDTDRWPERGGLTHDLQADLTATVLGALEHASAHVVGHSYGGGTAMRLIARYPGLVRSLALVEPILPALLCEANDPLSESAMKVGRMFVQSVDEGVSERGWEVFIDSRNGPGTWARMSGRSRSRFLAQSQQTREGGRPHNLLT